MSNEQARKIGYIVSVLMLCGGMSLIVYDIYCATVGGSAWGARFIIGVIICIFSYAAAKIGDTISGHPPAQEKE
ncbi:MAG: hypothetical protein KAX20_08220 [Candidatus Omnitrophica bacterium]|nr:hypothetical protein [Candidatus Omnitrophota bacterium]